MIRFKCDYSEGAHERILERLVATNREQTEGYGADPYCRAAGERIRDVCGDPSLDVHFVAGGTQANLIVVAAGLRPHQGVIAAESAHINAHETGAIEACGHKVLVVPSRNGKLAAAEIEACCLAYRQDESFEHVVQPKMVYISHPTELGTAYAKEELEALAAVCRAYRLFLFMDGARLGYGLTARDASLTLPDVAALCDVFSIGGTKMGALFGEAVVIRHPLLKEDFRSLIKQKGGMLAKGRLLGLQFLALFEDDLYLELGRHANALADGLRAAFRQAGFPFWVENTTNQVFPVLPDAVLDRLRESYSFAYQRRIDAGHSAVRFCTGWATRKEDVEALAHDLEQAARSLRVPV